VLASWCTERNMEKDRQTETHEAWYTQVAEEQNVEKDCTTPTGNQHGLNWIEQCFTSLPTQYRLYGRRFLQVKRPNQQYQSTEGDATKEKAKNENN